MDIIFIDIRCQTILVLSVYVYKSSHIIVRAGDELICICIYFCRHSKKIDLYFSLPFQLNSRKKECAYGQSKCFASMLHDCCSLNQSININNDIIVIAVHFEEFDNRSYRVIAFHLRQTYMLVIPHRIESTFTQQWQLIWSIIFFTPLSRFFLLEWSVLIHVCIQFEQYYYITTENGKCETI